MAKSGYIMERELLHKNFASDRRSRAAHTNVLMVPAVVLAPRQVTAITNEAVEVDGANDVVEPNRPGASAERLNLPASGGPQVTANNSGLAVCATTS